MIFFFWLKSGTLICKGLHQPIFDLKNLTSTVDVTDAGSTNKDLS